MSSWDSSFNTASIQQPTSIFGTPSQDALLFPGQQSYPDTCAIRCQEAILDEFGMPQSEAGLVQEAMRHGWYAPNAGTSPTDVGNLLELHGIPVQRYNHASAFNLAIELAQGHKVIVGVHANDLWNQPGSGVEAHRADHALIVTGIDTSDPLHVQVIVSDPGTGQPDAHYPMEQFLNAWKDSDFFMVATQQPVPPTVPTMANFDYTSGHLPYVGNVPYDEFHATGHLPNEWSHPSDSGHLWSPNSDLHTPSVVSHLSDGSSSHHNLTLQDIMHWFYDHVVAPSAHEHAELERAHPTHIAVSMPTTPPTHLPDHSQFGEITHSHDPMDATHSTPTGHTD